VSVSATAEQLGRYIDDRKDRLIEIAAELIRIPSENTPPNGAEGGCQRRVAAFLREFGWEPELYELDQVPGLREHALYWEGRDYTERPNVGARRRGTGGGRSLLLSGHIDTVPRGTQPWTRDPFGAQREGDRLFGRGSNDMKGGIAVNLFVLEALSALGIELAGDLLFETVVDEEFGGVNGTLAGRLQGFNADAAIISEPTMLRICPAQRGGRTAHIHLAANGGVLVEGSFPRGILDQLTCLLNGIADFAERRRRTAAVHEMYAHHADPVPVSITKIVTGPWGTKEPITIPEACDVEMYWQTMPGERQQDIEREFSEWLDELIASAPHLFTQRPQVNFPIRWLPGSSILRSDPLVRELAGCAAQVLGTSPPVEGIEGPCDMYVFHHFGISAALWGPRGGNTHAADEYLEIDSAVAAAKALLLFITRWCGVRPAS
jgi:acetylornithine deacetylase